MSRPTNLVRWTVVIVGVVYAVALSVSGVRLDGSSKTAVSYLPTAAVGVTVAFDLWLWKLPFALKLHRRPRVDGLWRATLQSDERSLIPDGGERGPIAAYLIIEQTFWSLSTVQLTAESRSDSRAAQILKRNHSTNRRLLSYTFDNTPVREHIQRSPRSTGACDLAVAAGAPTAIEGHYFTDRFTAGALKAKLIDRTTNYESFDDADAHVNSLGQ